MKKATWSETQKAGIRALAAKALYETGYANDFRMYVVFFEESVEIALACGDLRMKAVLQKQSIDYAKMDLVTAAVMELTRELCKSLAALKAGQCGLFERWGLA